MSPKSIQALQPATQRLTNIRTIDATRTRWIRCDDRIIVSINLASTHDIPFSLGHVVGVVLVACSMPFSIPGKKEMIMNRICECYGEGCEDQATCIHLERDFRHGRTPYQGDWVYGGGAPDQACLLCRQCALSTQDPQFAEAYKDSHVVLPSIPESAQVLTCVLTQWTLDCWVEPLTDDLKSRIRKNAHHIFNDEGGPYADVLAHIYADHVQKLGCTNWLDCLLGECLPDDHKHWPPPQVLLQAVPDIDTPQIQPPRRSVTALEHYGRACRRIRR